MSRRNKQRAQLRGQSCVYCGVAPATTLDDIPPKCFFTKPRGKLLLVPACVNCNGGASDDDEWFRNDVVMEYGNAQHPMARELADSAFRGLFMPEKRRMLATFINLVQKQEVRTEAGLYVTTPTYYMRAEPQRRVVSRIVKALYWHHHNNTRLDDAYEVWSHPHSSAPRDVRQALDNAVAFLLQLQKHTLGNGEVFSYYFFETEDDPFAVLWLLVFYQRFGVLALTRRADKRAGKTEAEASV